MKKTKAIVAKALSLILTTGVLVGSLPIQATYAATTDTHKVQNKSNFKTGVLYEDDTVKITQSDNTRTVLDKKTSKTIVVTFTDSKHSKGTYKDLDGNIKKYSTDAQGNIYLDNECVVKATRSAVRAGSGVISLNGYTNDDYFTGDDGFTYYYVTEYTYDTKTVGDAESIALGILSFIPFVGPIYGVAGIVETARSYGADKLYVVQDMYCTSDYSHYVYKNYFYTDKGHSDLVDSNEQYKRMF